MRSKHAKPTTVLVVEDESTVRTLAESIIETLGFTIFSAANAREAIALLEARRAYRPIVHRHQLAGWARRDRWARTGPESRRALPLRVIYTTGHGQTDGMTALFVEDAAFLPKPYRVKQLTEAVLATAEEPAR